VNNNHVYRLRHDPGAIVQPVLYAAVT